MLAVNRPYGRSDYLPCICWGALARRARLWSSGQRLALEGRVQSREYLKMTESGPEKHTAFEVSAMKIEEETSGTSFVEALDWGR
jgi:single-stranded DNA-binding protein